MLTPAKIKNHHFDASGRNAYKAESVDSFFEEVAESYEQMFKENGEMYKKIGLLAERLEEYKKDEDNIRNALLVAQRMAEKITREAQEQADALLEDAKTRAKTENDRIDAVTNDMMQKAAYEARAIIDDAKAQAEKMIYDATYESKAAAVSARDQMIKEEAALEMMKAEATKFKRDLLAMYDGQLELIEKIPEIVYAMQEKAAEVVDETETTEVEEPVAEEPIAEAAAVMTEEEIPAPQTETAEEVSAQVSEEASQPAENSIAVEQLQQMIPDEDEAYKAEDDGDDDENETEEFDAEVSVDNFVMPEIEDDEEEIVKLEEEISENGANDIMFTKPKTDDSKGFNLNFDSFAPYRDPLDDDDDGEDELDNFDEDDGDDDGGIASKFKGFFKK